MLSDIRFSASFQCLEESTHYASRMVTYELNQYQKYLPIPQNSGDWRPLSQGLGQ